MDNNYTLQFYGFPDEIHRNIIKYLPCKDLASLSLTCKYFCALVQGEVIIEYYENKYTMAYTYVLGVPIDLTSTKVKGLPAPRIPVPRVLKPEDIMTFDRSYIKQLHLIRLLLKIEESRAPKYIVSYYIGLKKLMYCIDRPLPTINPRVVINKAKIINKLVGMFSEYEALRIESTNNINFVVHPKEIMRCMPRLNNLEFNCDIFTDETFPQIKVVGFKTPDFELVNRMHSVFPCASTIHICVTSIYDVYLYDFTKFKHLNEVHVSELIDVYSDTHGNELVILDDNIDESKEWWKGKAKINKLIFDDYCTEIDKADYIKLFSHIFNHITEGPMLY